MKKFLSLILALTLVASLFTVNVMAASKAHTMTLAADKTTELKAGDIVTVTVSLDNTENIQSLGYRILFDTDAFDIDRTKGWESDEDYDMHENFIDKTWYDSVLTDVWGKRLTTFKYGYDDPEVGCITFGWTGTAVPASKVVDNFVLGKFTFIVKDGVADGSYEIKLDLDNSSTTDTGENFGAAMASTPLTLKVGADGPVVVPPTVGGSAAVDTPYTNAFAVKAEITPGSATEIGVLFAPDVWLTAQGLTNDKLVYGLAGAAKATLTGDALGKGVITLKAAIRDIPRDVEGKAFKMVTRAYAANGADVTYADAVATDYTAFAE